MSNFIIQDVIMSNVKIHDTTMYSMDNFDHFLSITNTSRKQIW